MDMQNRQIHGVIASSSADKILLAVFFILGVAGILLFKFAFFNTSLKYEFSNFIPSIYTAIILILYATITHFSFSHRLEPEDIGDNCYYLGFLFTLTSLAVTLYGISSNSDEFGNDSFIKDVISGFGIALSSTIIGILLRVLFLQLKPNLVAREKETRVELEQAVRSFSKTLHRTVGSFRGFSTEIQQSLFEHNSKLFESTKLAQKNITSENINSFQAVTTGIEEQNLKMSRNFEKSLEQTLTQLTDVNTKVLNKSQNMLEDLYKQTLTQLTELNANILGESQSALDASYIKTAEAMDGFESNLNSLSKSIKEQQEILTSMGSDAIHELAEASSEVSKSSLKLNNAITKHTDQAEKAALKFGKSTDKLLGELTHSNEVIMEQTTHTNEALKGAAQTVKEAAERVTTLMKKKIKFPWLFK